MAKTTYNPNTGGMVLNTVMKSLGETLGGVVENTAAQAIQGVMNHQGNVVSAQAQAEQGAFNQASADLANSIDTGRLSNQYQFNSAMMSSANDFTANQWERAAQWNEAMWEKQAAFNAEQAQLQRDWQERMSNTSYQRAMEDMSKAGLNPILAYSNGGAQVPGGAAATVGGAQMSSAQSQMASGGIVGANAASENNYTGQAEWTAGILALLATAVNGFASAKEAEAKLNQMTGKDDVGDGFINGLSKSLTGSYKNTEGEHVSGMLENKLNGLKIGIREAINGKENEVKMIHDKRSNHKAYQFRLRHSKG